MLKAKARMRPFPSVVAFLSLLLPTALVPCLSPRPCGAAARVAPRRFPSISIERGNHRLAPR